MQKQSTDIGIAKRCVFSIDFRRENKDSRGDELRSYVKMPKPQKHMHPAFPLRPSFTPALTKRPRSAPDWVGLPSFSGGGNGEFVACQ